MKKTRTGAGAARGAGLLRRTASLCYDGLVVIALWFVATACLLPFNRGEALPPGQWLYSLYLLTITAVFFGWFWTHGGQTLGMKAWSLRVCTKDGEDLDRRRAAVRLLAATVSYGAFGIGHLWILLDRENLAWHDRLSGTRVVRIPRASSPAPDRIPARIKHS